MLLYLAEMTLSLKKSTMHVYLSVALKRYCAITATNFNRTKAFNLAPANKPAARSADRRFILIEDSF